MSSSQAVTPPDTLLEKLMDELIASGRAYYDSWIEKDDGVRVARAALREYVSARTLTEDEALFLYGITPHPGCTRSVGRKRDAIIERFLDVFPRPASMKEPE